MWKRSRPWFLTWLVLAWIAVVPISGQENEALSSVPSWRAMEPVAELILDGLEALGALLGPEMEPVGAFMDVEDGGSQAEHASADSTPSETGETFGPGMEPHGPPLLEPSSFGPEMEPHG